MADLGINRLAGADPLQGVSQARQSDAGAAAAAVKKAADKSSAAAVQTNVGELTRELSARAPVDTNKVEEIRAAIRSGNYQIEPYTIAEAMIRSLRG